MTTAWQHRIRDALCAFALAATIAAVHAPWPGAHLTAHHDNLDGAAPLRVEAARQWRSGQVPLWNPFKRAGMPLLADTTAGAIYPGNFPFLFADDAAADSGNDAPVFDAFDRVAALHAAMAAVFLFAFLRGAGLHPAAAFFGGLVFGACGTMGWLAAWYMQIQNSVVWLPLILLAVQRAHGAKGLALPWVTAGGAAVALQFLAGFPETSVYSALLAIGYAASRAQAGARRGPFVAVVAVYAAGLLLAAVQLLPAVELLLASRRPAALDLATFQSLAVSPAMVRDWILPPTESSLAFPPPAALHFGASAVLAAIAGAWSRSRLALYLATVLVVGFLLAIGPATPVSAWAWHLPGLSAFRHPFKHLFEVSFAIAGLAGVGAHTLLQRRPDARWTSTVVAAAIAFTAVALRVNQASLVSGNPASVDVSGTQPAIVREFEPGWRAMTLRQFFQKRDPAYLIGDYPTQFRVAAVHGAGPYLWKALADATGLVEEEVTFRRGLFSAADRTLALLSCRYVRQDRSDKGFAPAVDPYVYRTLVETPESRWMERADALPRLRFVRAVRCATPAQIDESLHLGRPDPRDVALVDCAADDSVAGVFDVEGLAMDVEQERPGFLSLRTTIPADRRAFLVVSQSDLPGWTATADGAPVEVRRVHGLVQGLMLPGGTSRVELVYAPKSVRIGALASGATLALLLAGCALGRRQRPKS